MNNISQKAFLGLFAICGLITFGGELVAQERERSVSEHASAESEGSEVPVVEEIVIVGVRRSLSVARDLKRESEQFVDFVVADDIGRLPDANVAESLQRVSGVQIDRGIGGEGIDIAIRGLRQNLILFNGRQILDAEGRGGNGPDTLGSFTYGLLSSVPSELVSKLEVTKLAGADQIHGGVGGVVNIVSRRPLDGLGRQVVASVAATDNSLADGTGFEVFGLFSNAFRNDTVGILISGAIRERDFREDGINTLGGYGSIANLTLEDSAGNPVDPDPNGDGFAGIFLADPRIQQIDDERTRTGINGIFQFRPTDRLELYFDSYFAETESDRIRHWIGMGRGGLHTDVVLSPNEVLLSSTFTGPVQSNTEMVSATNEIFSNAIGLKAEISDDFSMFAEITHAKSESQADQEFYRLQTPTSMQIQFDISGGEFPDVVFPASLDLTDPSQLNLAIIFDNFDEQVNETEASSARLDFDWELNSESLSSLEFGVYFEDLDSDLKRVGADIRPGVLLTSGDLIELTEIFSSPDFVSGHAPSLPRSYLAADPRTARLACDAPQLQPFLTPANIADCNKTEDPLQRFQVAEEFLSTYAKLNYDAEVGGKQVSGNVGVRYVRRRLVSGATQQLDDGMGGVVQEFDETLVEDNLVLPSVVVKVIVNDRFQLRFGAAEVAQFPNTRDLNNGLFLFQTFAAGFGGSPLLDPFQATQFDVSGEYYFGDDGLLSIGLFYKDISSFVISDSNPEDIPGLGTFIIDRKVNGTGGEINGLELLYQQSFGYLGPGFDAFGVNVTYSYIDSETPFVDRLGNSLPLPGLSKNNVNIVAYYEKERFSARIGYNWRDDYLGSISSFENTGVFFDGFSDLTANIRYNLNDNFSIEFEGTNLLDTEQRQFNSFPEALRRNVSFGRTLILTVTARL